MASKWTTVTFVQAFLQGKLGRKRVHGTYRVLDGDHCKVLVRATTNYGRPTGNDLIALNVDTDTEHVSFFHTHNTKCFTYRMNSELDTYNAPKLPGEVLSDGDPQLLASGVIDVNDDEMLIEIGDKPYLLYKKKSDDGTALVWAGCIATFSELNTIPARVATISEAKELVSDPVGAVKLCHLWWAYEQPFGFQPPGLDDSTRKVLSTPVNPLDHGYRLDECSILDGGGSDRALQTLVPYNALLQEPHDQRARSYLAARNCWNDTCDTVKARTPINYKGLTTRKNKYGYTSDENADRTGQIVKASNGVFIQGIITNEGMWNTQERLDRWYKLHSEINRVTLGVRR